MFSKDPLKELGYRIIYAAVLIHGVAIWGKIDDSPGIHIIRMIGAILWSVWMMQGNSILPLVMNVLGTGLACLTFIISGISLLDSPHQLLSLILIGFGLYHGHLCKRLCSKDIRARFSD